MRSAQPGVAVRFVHAPVRRSLAQTGNQVEQLEVRPCAREQHRGRDHGAQRRPTSGGLAADADPSAATVCRRMKSCASLSRSILPFSTCELSHAATNARSLGCNFVGDATRSRSPSIPSIATSASTSASVLSAIQASCGRLRCGQADPAPPDWSAAPGVNHADRKRHATDPTGPPIGDTTYARPARSRLMVKLSRHPSMNSRTTSTSRNPSSSKSGAQNSLRILVAHSVRSATKLTA